MESKPAITLTDITDRMGLGIIYVKEDGRIARYSNVAQEIFGLMFPKGKSHGPGSVRKGDIVILADNMLGNDDAMSPGDLYYIGISDPDIRPGDAFVAIGAYQDPLHAPVYKYYSGFYPESELKLKEKYRGHDISVSIDLNKKTIAVTVNGETYDMAYLQAIGFMVTVKPETGEVRFFQGIGYGFRGEEPGKLLRGAPYKGKNWPGQEEDPASIIGMPLKRIAFGDEFLQEVRKLMELPDGARSEGPFEIYRRLVFCTMIRVQKGSENDGVLIMIRDRSNIESSLKAGAAYMAELESRNKKASLMLDSDREEHFGKFLGESAGMQAVKHLAYKASRTRFNVILLGESGTGKSRLAREIHNIQNPNAPFVEVACNSIAPSLFESELFGYAPGSFTGADKNGRIGYFEEAGGGTIFLDEIGEIPSEIQAKLLYVLQNKQIYRVGSPKPIPIDVRVITATSRDLDEEIRQGRFRQDLYYRINVFPIKLPPLRDRRQDIPAMANSILSDLCDRYNMEPKRFSDEALKIITVYDWPGNVRELENIIERAITVCEGSTIYADHLFINEPAPGPLTLKERLEQDEARIIAGTLIANNGDRQKTMEDLGMSRSAFYRKLKEYKLI